MSKKGDVVVVVILRYLGLCREARLNRALTGVLKWWLLCMNIVPGDTRLSGGPSYKHIRYDWYDFAIARTLILAIINKRLRFKNFQEIMALSCFQIRP